jgi:FecR protein
MSVHHDPRRDGDIEALLRESIKTRAVDARRVARVRDAVHAEWSITTKARTRSSRWPWAMGGLAAAAAIIFALRPEPGPNLAESGPSAKPVATVRYVRGTAQVRTRPDAPLTPLRVGDTLAVGAIVVADGDAAGAVTLDTGVDVRVGPLSELALASARRIVLRRGRVYVDSGGRREQGSGRALEVAVAGSVVRDIGTRFMVTGGTTVSIGVRDGRVELDQGGATYTAAPGEHLTVSAEGRVTTSRRAVFGPEWDWIVQAAPPESVDGRTLQEFLAWVEREGGRSVRFADATLGRSARSTVVYGTIDGLTVDEALAVVLPTCGLTHRVDDGVITVVAADEPAKSR